MLQTTLSVPLDVKPESTAQLEALIEEFKELEDKQQTPGTDNFARLINGIPTLHFMSINVFKDPRYDPIFIIEVNCDGAVGPFWAHFESIAGEQLRDMVRCCKRPMNRHAELYDSVTAKGSRTSLTPYLEAMTERPSVFHHGNRGLPRQLILDEAALFRAIRSKLDGPEVATPAGAEEANPQAAGGYRGLSADKVHAHLRHALEAQFSWLNEQSPTRVTALEIAADQGRLFLFSLALLFALSLPGILAAALLPFDMYLVCTLVLCMVLLASLFGLKDARQETLVKDNVKSVSPNLFALIKTLAIVVVPPVAAMVFLGCALAGLSYQIFDFEGVDRKALYGSVASTILWGQLGVLVTLPAIVLWLRLLERNEPSQFNPPISDEEVGAMQRREDWVSQNHMMSIVHIRPGVLRTIIARAGHLGLGLILRGRTGEKNGYLGSMRTVHFAHWAFLNNGSRLLFFSNFDQSWGSYLDDFIEKAHGGLTLAWGCGVGFPPTRFLVLEGASHGRLFKNWALASRTASRFWCSAYPGLSVDQIERNHRIAEGLRHTRLSPDMAKKWVEDL